MCECCGGDCRLCGGYGHLDFPEPITKVYVRETVSEDGFRLEELIINDKWKMVEDSSLNPPFRYEEIMDKQPLNEEYKNEILEAYQKISDTFDDFTQLMRARVPYESWPKHLQIAGISEDLLGPADKKPVPDFADQISEHCDECAGELENALEDGWLHCQPNCRPDKSFRAMIGIISKWKTYLQSQKPYKARQHDIWDTLRERGFDPTKALPTALISRIEDIGRAQEKLKNILDEELFDNLSKHDPFWDSKHELESEKLDDLRRKLSCLSDNLWDLWAILRKEEE